MIDNNKIETLLNSFYNGSTTKEEEQMLREYFVNTNDVPAHLEADRQLFINISEAECDTIPEGLEARLETFIDSLDIENVNRVKHINWKWASSIAATVIIALSIGITYFNYDSNVKVERKDTYTNVDQAYSEAERALLLISEKMNKGEAQYAKAQTKVEELTEILNRNLNN